MMMKISSCCYCLLFFCLTLLLIRTFADSRTGDNSIVYVSSLNVEGSTSVNSTLTSSSAYSGNIALTSSNEVLFQSTNSIKKWNINTNLITTFSIKGGGDAPIIVNELSQKQIFTLKKSNGAYLTSPGVLSILERLNPTDLSVNMTILLSMNVSIGFGSALFSGIRRLVVVDADSSNAYNIDLSDGQVTLLSSNCLIRWESSNDFLSFGIAEYYNFDATSLVYGNYLGNIERQGLSALELNIVSSLSFDRLASISLDLERQLWYYYYTGSGPFGSTSVATLGLAKAEIFEALPTSEPTSEPSDRPSRIPSSEPTRQPTGRPSIIPSSQPSSQPSRKPSAVPTSQPTRHPSSMPFAHPSSQPSASPSTKPSNRPSSHPTAHPTSKPSDRPTSKPTGKPSQTPSRGPTGQPTSQPTRQPSRQPTSSPSRSPTAQPTRSPSGQPSSRPSSQPSGQPTSQPSSQPAGVPTSLPSSQPSVQPTAQPFSMPTSKPSSQPTSSPSFTVSAPQVRNLVIAATRTSLSLTVTIDGRSKYGGQVACVAQLSSVTTTPTQTTIFVNGQTANYVSGQTTVAITLGGLSPVTSYATYCAVSTSNGLVSDPTDITNTRRTTKTSCCKLVQFTSAPASVYSDSSKYKNQPASSYTFYYSLSNIPGRSVTIIPSLQTSAGTSLQSKVTITPSKLSFLAVSTSLQGSFILSATDTTFSGSYILSLNVTGNSSSEYTSTSTSVAFLTSYSIPSAPKLTSALFGDGGSDIFITFDSATNLGGFSYSASWRCGSIFQFSGSNVTDCYWLNSTAVRGVFRTVANASLLANIGNPVSLLSSKIKADCPSTVSSDVCKRYNFSLPQSISLIAAYNPVTPTVILKMPASVGSCDNVSIDTTQTSGYGGRSFSKVVWSVSALSGTGDVTSILASLNKYGKNVLRVFTIPRSFFGSGTYSISLTLTNFLGSTSSSSGVIQAISNPNIPKVNILGGSAITTYAYQSLTIYSSVAFPSCADTTNSKLTYNWQLSLNSAPVALGSTGKNPALYLISTYQLKAGNVYRLLLNATVAVRGVQSGFASATQDITVLHGVVRAVVRGGSSRQLSIDRNVTLDGTGSSDEDSSDNTALSFSWSCAVSSFTDYGTDCTKVIEPVSRAKQSAIIMGNSMDLDHTYAITLTIASSDGRTASTTINIQPLSAGAPLVGIVTRRTVFNIGSNLSIDGTVQARGSVFAIWEAFVNSVNITLKAYSPTVVSLPASFVLNSFTSTLLTGSAGFSAGTVVTFQLRAFLQAASTVSSTAQISLTANGPPYGGSLSVSPSEGYGLSTQFTLQSLGWVDDPTNYPFTFAFYYLTSSKSPALVVRAASQLSVVTSTFPTGLQSNDYKIIAQVSVADIYSASTSTTQTFVVKNDINVDVTTYLSSSLTTAFASSNSETALLTVNNVASTINTVNCSLVLGGFCSNLNRAECSTTSQTCGGCLTGYKGTVGNANSKCFSANSTVGNPGSGCQTGSDCLYGNCTAGVCITPVMQCPTAVTGIPCSGHGTCGYFNPSGQAFNSPCLITNVFCEAQCTCDSDYGGSDCSLDASKRLQRDSGRGTLCDAIIKIGNISNPSPQLLGNLVSSLYSAYNPDEIFTTETSNLCSSALQLLTKLSNQGYLAGAPADTASLLLQVTSKFVKGSTKSTVSAAAVAIRNNLKIEPDTVYAASTTDTSSTSNSNIGETISNITNGIFLSLKNGQAPIAIATDNIRISLSKSLISDLDDAVFTPPQTEAESTYGVPTNSIQFNGSASACNTGSGFAHLSVAVWGKNPYPNASSIHSPLLRFTNRFEGSSTSNTVDTSVTDSSPTTYFITVQFVTKQNFNRTEIDYVRRHPSTKSNATFPSCGMYENGKYASCGNCNVSTYTDYNVTFVCEDISRLCYNPSQSVSSSVSSNTMMDSWEMMHLLSKNVDNYLSSLDGDELREGRRRLGQDDDLFSDDSTSVGSGMSIQQYGALLEGLGNTFVDTLSVNPFDINLAEAKPILIFLSILIFSFIFGSIFFIAWDESDRFQLMYANNWPPKPNQTIKKLKYMVKKRTLKDHEWSLLNPMQQAEKKSIEEILEEDRVRYDNSKMGLIKTKEADVNLGLDSPTRAVYRSASGGPSMALAMHDAAGSSLLPPPISIDDRGNSLRSNTSSQQQDERFISPYTMRSAITDSSAGVNSSQVRKIAKLQSKHRNLVFSSNISVFFDLVIPDILVKADFFSFIRSVTIKHEYLTIFFRASSQITRFARWIGLFSNILISLLVSTLFFGTFFKNDGQCESFTTSDDCLSLYNSAIGQSSCLWVDDDVTGINQASGHCKLNSPPNNISFTVITALTCVLVALPMQLFVSYVIDYYCTKRPRLEEIGLNTDYWFGHGASSSFMDIQDTRISLLQQNFLDAERLLTMKSTQTMSGTYAVGSIHSTPQNDMISPTTYNSASLAFSLKLKRRNNFKNYLEAIRQYHTLTFQSVQTIDEELQLLFYSIQRHYASINSWNANLSPIQLEAWKESFEAKENAIRYKIGVNNRGQFLPLRFYEYLFYWNGKHKLYKKFHRIRNESMEINREMQEISTVSTQLKEVVLLNHFILEQFNPFKRWVLESQLLCYQGFVPKTIDPFSWFAAWIFVALVFLFCFYWIYSWGITDGGALLSNWGLNFAIDVVQDIFFVQIAKVGLVYLVAILSIREQLQTIRYHLHTLAMSYIQGNIPVRKYLQASTSDYFSVFQHLSPVCRIAWKENFNDLVMSKILRQIDDYDIILCRKHDDSRLGLVGVLIVIIPIAIIFFGELGGEAAIESLLPTLSSGFVIANYYLYSFSLLILLVPYIIIVGFIVWYVGIFRTTRKYMIRKSQLAKEEEQMEQFLATAASLKRKKSKMMKTKSGRFSDISYSPASSSYDALDSTTASAFAQSSLFTRSKTMLRRQSEKTVNAEAIHEETKVQRESKIAKLFNTLFISSVGSAQRRSNLASEIYTSVLEPMLVGLGYFANPGLVFYYSYVQKQKLQQNSWRMMNLPLHLQARTIFSSPSEDDAEGLEDPFVSVESEKEKIEVTATSAEQTKERKALRLQEERLRKKEKMKQLFKVQYAPSHSSEMMSALEQVQNQFASNIHTPLIHEGDGNPATEIRQLDDGSDEEYDYNRPEKEDEGEEEGEKLEEKADEDEKKGSYEHEMDITSFYIAQEEENFGYEQTSLFQTPRNLSEYDLFSGSYIPAAAGITNFRLREYGLMGQSKSQHSMYQQKKSQSSFNFGRRREPATTAGIASTSNINLTRAQGLLRKASLEEFKEENRPKHFYKLMSHLTEASIVQIQGDDDFSIDSTPTARQQPKPSLNRRKVDRLTQNVAINSAIKQRKSSLHRRSVSTPTTLPKQIIALKYGAPLRILESIQTNRKEDFRGGKESSYDGFSINDDGLAPSTQYNSIMFTPSTAGVGNGYLTKLLNKSFFRMPDMNLLEEEYQLKTEELEAMEGMSNKPVKNTNGESDVMLSTTTLNDATGKSALKPQLSMVPLDPNQSVLYNEDSFELANPLFKKNSSLIKPSSSTAQRQNHSPSFYHVPSLNIGSYSSAEGEDDKPQAASQSRMFSKPFSLPRLSMNLTSAPSAHISWMSPRGGSPTSRSVMGNLKPKFHPHSRRGFSVATIYQEEQHILSDIHTAIMQFITMYLQLLFPVTSENYEILSMIILFHDLQIPILIKDITLLLSHIWEVYYPIDGIPLTSSEKHLINNEFREFILIYYPDEVMMELKIFIEWFQIIMIKFMKYHIFVLKKRYLDSQSNPDSNRNSQSQWLRSTATTPKGVTASPNHSFGAQRSHGQSSHQINYEQYFSKQLLHTITKKKRQLQKEKQKMFFEQLKKQNSLRTSLALNLAGDAAVNQKQHDDNTMPPMLGKINKEYRESRRFDLISADKKVTSPQRDSQSSNDPNQKKPQFKGLGIHDEMMKHLSRYHMTDEKKAEEEEVEVGDAALPANDPHVHLFKTIYERQLLELRERYQQQLMARINLPPTSPSTNDRFIRQKMHHTRFITDSIDLEEEKDNEHDENKEQEQEEEEMEDQLLMKIRLAIDERIQNELTLLKELERLDDEAEQDDDDDSFDLEEVIRRNLHQRESIETTSSSMMSTPSGNFVLPIVASPIDDQGFSKESRKEEQEKEEALQPLPSPHMTPMTTNEADYHPSASRRREDEDDRVWYVNHKLTEKH